MRIYEDDRPGKRWYTRECIIPAGSVTGEICYYWCKTKAEREQRVAAAPTKRRAVDWDEVARIHGINFVSIPVPEEEVEQLGEPMPAGKVVDQRRRPKTP